jgi:hypothetical protein
MTMLKAVELRWDGYANTCRYCKSHTTNLYVTTGHDHTDTTIHLCNCGGGESVEKAWDSNPFAKEKCPTKFLDSTQLIEEIDRLAKLLKVPETYIQHLPARFIRYAEETLGKRPVAWLREAELEDLKTCNYRSVGADSPDIWRDDRPDSALGLVPVFLQTPEVAGIKKECEALEEITVVDKQSIRDLRHELGLVKRENDALRVAAKTAIEALRWADNGYQQGSAINLAIEEALQKFKKEGVT